MVAPREFTAPMRLNLLAAVDDGPSIVTKGFAATCNMVIPAANVLNATRKNLNNLVFAAGINNRDPKAAINNQNTIPFLYPNFCNNIPEGSDIKK